MVQPGCFSQDELAAFHLGELPDANVDRIAEHLESCADCAATVRELDRLADPLLTELQKCGTAARHVTEGQTLTLDSGSTGPLRLPQIADYEILDELGRGGMGVVYLARHARLRRLVALKMLLAGEFTEEARRARFRSEAELVARLRHPHVVQLFEVGECTGNSGIPAPYFTLEYLEGGSLAEHCKGKPQAPAQAMAWVEALARATHYAHQQGIVHRDLKPANVLLTAEGDPKICDFGVAKLLAGSDARTRSGVLIGTAEYMAPEQAAGRADIGPAVDIYALGVILYELLTGRPPFRAATTLDTLTQVRSQEPVAPRRLQPGVPRDLETICLKCLEKEPARRYATAADLADDLGRFARLEPIRARPVSLGARGLKWARRRPALASLVFLSVLVVAIGFPTVTGLWLRSERAFLQSEESLYFARISQAENEYAANKLADMKTLLDACRPVPGRPDWRGWEWFYLYRLTHPDLLPEATITPTGSSISEWVYSLTFSADGRTLAAGGGVPLFLQYTGDEPASLKFWDVSARRAAPSFPALSDVKSVIGLACSPDGRLIIATGNPKRGGVDAIQSIDPRSGAWQPLHAPPGAPVGFSPDGRGLALQAGDKLILWDLPSDQQRWKTPMDMLAALVFSTDGKRLFGLKQGVFYTWDVATGNVLQQASGFIDSRPASWQSKPVISPNGRWLAYPFGSGDLIRITDTESRAEYRTLRGHAGEVTSLAFSADSRSLASGGADALVRVWEVETGAERCLFRGHTQLVTRLTFSPHGDYLASGGWDGWIKLWDLTRAPEYRTLKQNPEDDQHPYVEDLAFDRDSGRLRAVLATQGRMLEWDIGSIFPCRNEPVPLTSAHLVPGHEGAFSSDGRWLAGAVPEPVGDIKVWDTATRSEIITCPTLGVPVSMLAWSANGQALAAVGIDLRRPVPDRISEVRVWSADHGGERLRVSALAKRHSALALSPDGSLLALAVRPQTGSASERHPFVQVWHIPSGRLLKTLDGHGELINALIFSPDGRKLISGDTQGAFFAWDVNTGQKLFPFQGGPFVTQLAFSPDGRRLAGVNREATFLWDAATGRKILTLRGRARLAGDPPFNPCVAWSHDGKHLAASQADRSINVWSAAEADLP